MNEPRVYKNSSAILLLIIFLFGAIILGISVGVAQGDWIIKISVAAVFSIILLGAFLSMTSKTIISDDEISTQTIFSTKTLRWNEINRASGRGSGIKLHNFDGDVTISPSSRLPKYEEVIEWIGTKRPDLFNPRDYSEMTRNWFLTLFPVAFGFIFIGLGLFVFFMEQEAFYPSLILAGVGIFLIGSIISTPNSVTIEGNSLLINYVLQQKTLLADEISFINLSYTQTRNGKVYYIAISLKSGKTIRISGLTPSLPIAYLVLRNWHKKNTGLSS